MNYSVRHNTPRIVGIGASAGGLVALEEFFAAVPVDSGLAFVVIPHLSRNHESHLADLLGRVTSMPVLQLTENVVPQKNTVYVRPPLSTVEVGNGLELYPRPPEKEHGPDHAVDDFLVSLAAQRKEEAIGIILSGMGSDGKRGVQQIREMGGIVLVQDPETAQFDGMPRSAIRENAADLVASPGQLAEQLLYIIEHEREREPATGGISDPELQSFLSRLFSKVQKVAGIDFSRYRSTTIMRRLEKRMLILQIDTLEEYEKILKEDEEEFAALYRSFLIGVTRFFRDKEFYNVISSRVLGELFEQLPPEQTLRVWVPACSTGEEAYSYCILIAEYLRGKGLQRDYKILASDVDRQALEVASKGRYNEGIASDLPEGILQRYFSPAYGGYQVVSEIRERILFAEHNLLTDPPFIHLHLLSCRNFLIYIDPVAQNAVLENFHFALEESGFLALGPSEGLGRLKRAFTTYHRRWKIFTRNAQGSARLPLKRLGTISADVELLNKKVVAMDNNRDLPPAGILPGGSGTTDPFSQYLSERYAPAVLFVDGKYHIHYLNGAVDDLLHFPRQHAEFTLRKVFESSISTLLIAAIDEVLTDSNFDSRDYKINLKIKGKGKQDYTVRVGKVELPAADMIMAMIEFHPNHDGVGAEASISLESSNELLQRRIEILTDQVVQSKHRSQKLLVELEATNEELQTSNRELLAANEEMQSTNEELQSVNEELYSLNGEMQRKNEELKRLNNDMNHLLESTEIGTIFLDRELIIRRFTPTIRYQFDFHPSDIGRPLSAFSSSFDDLKLVDACREVLKTQSRLEREVADRNGVYYLLRILPYQSAEIGNEGLIVTFVNISELQRTRAELAAMALKYKAIFEHSTDVIIVLESSGRIESLNRWFEEDGPPGVTPGSFFIDHLATKNDMLRFNRCIRSVIDDRTVVEEDFSLVKQGPDTPRHIHVVFYFVDVGSGIDGRENFQVVLVISDVSKREEEKKRFNFLLREYQERIEKKGVTGGLMQLDGTILLVNRAGTSEESPSSVDYLRSNTYDYLSTSGKEKLRTALGNILEGSREEIVFYTTADFNETYPGEDMRVQYRPVISGGEVLFVTVTNLTAR